VSASDTSTSRARIAGSDRAAQWALLGLVLAGAAVRIGCARGDLWLDEIWAFALARRLHSFGEIFSSVHFDTNHYLYTVWLMLVGDASPLVLRGLALACGALTLLLVAGESARRGWSAALATTALFAASPILVQYDSEARGYAPMVLFSVASYAALARLLESGERRWAFVFSLCATAGLLSHLTFLWPLGGFTAWVLVELLGNRRSARRSALPLATLGVPYLLLTVLWIVDLRHLGVGGGPVYGFGWVLRQLFRSMLALPPGPAEWLSLAAVATVGWVLVLLARQGDSRWVFFAVTMVGAPAFVLLVRPFEYLTPRHFLAAVPFFLMLLGRGFSRLARHGAAGRIALALLLVSFCAASAWPTGRLLRDGRGHYRQAVAYMASHTAGDTVSYASDHPFRNRVIVDYYAARSHQEKTFRQADEFDPTDPPLWYLRQDTVTESSPPERVKAPDGTRYALAAQFPYSGLSGWRWALYRRAD